MQRIRGRSVESGGLNLACPLNRHQRLTRDTGSERERRGAQSLHACKCSPGPDVQAKERADQHPIVRPQTSAPKNSCVRFPDPLPIVGADPEHRWPTGGAARAVNPRHLAGIDAEVIAERGVSGLRGAQLVLLDHRKSSQIVQRLQRIGRNSCRFPLASVKRAVCPRVSNLRGELGENQLLLIGRGGAFNLRKPKRTLEIRAIGRIVVRRPPRQVDAATARDSIQTDRSHAHSGAREAASSRIRETIWSGEVSWPNTSATPIARKGSTSSSGITPPTTTETSAAPAARSSSRIRGTNVRWAPESRLTPRTSTSS